MKQSIRYVVIALIGALLFLPFLGQVHLFDWDEINFAECAREMIVTGNFLKVQIDYSPFWEKPPLFIWLQVLSMKLWGINEYAARFPNAVAGIVTLVSLYHIGRKTINEKVGLWWALLYAATWLPHFYFKTGIIDPVFNLFIFLAVYQIYRVKYAQKPLLHALLAGALLGLAVLTKGPVAILVSGLAFTVFIIVNKGFKGYKLVHILLVAISAILVTATWFGVEIAGSGWGLVKEFIDYQVGLFSQNIADHQEPWFYHPVVLLIGCFPTSILLFQYGKKGVQDNEKSRDFTRWMWILFWVVLILFSIVKTKIVHYSSLCYYPITYLGALQIYRLSNSESKPKAILKVLMLVIGSLLAIAITALPFVGIFKEKLIPLIDDPFAVGNLQANIHWHWTESLWGLAYLIIIWVCVLGLKKNFRNRILILFIAQLVIIQVTVLHFTPKIEAISQRAAIDFYKQFQGKDVYVQVLDFKSYAHLFYTHKQPSTNPNYLHTVFQQLNGKDTVAIIEANKQWLLNGNIDKPAYFVCKIQDADEYRQMPTLQEIGAKNGFVFFKRK